MILSVGGMLAAYAVFSYSTEDYYAVWTFLASTPFFWFYGFFSVPFFTGLIDVIEFNVRLFFFPTEEMLYREIDLNR